MNLIALLISAYCISYLFDPDFRFLIKNDLVRLIAAILIACMLLPEVWMNITNIQWFLLIYTMLSVTNLIFNKGSADKKIGFKLICQVVFLCLSFLSTPLSFMLFSGIIMGLTLRARDKKAITPQIVLYLISTLFNTYSILTHSLYIYHFSI